MKYKDSNLRQDIGMQIQDLLIYEKYQIIL